MRLLLCAMQSNLLFTPRVEVSLLQRQPHEAHHFSHLVIRHSNDQAGVRLNNIGSDPVSTEHAAI